MDCTRVQPRRAESETCLQNDGFSSLGNNRICTKYAISRHCVLPHLFPHNKYPDGIAYLLRPTSRLDSIEKSTGLHQLHEGTPANSEERRGCILHEMEQILANQRCVSPCSPNSGSARLVLASTWLYILRTGETWIASRPSQDGPFCQGRIQRNGAMDDPHMDNANPGKNFWRGQFQRAFDSLVQFAEHQDATFKSEHRADSEGPLAHFETTNNVYRAELKLNYRQCGPSASTRRGRDCVPTPPTSDKKLPTTEKALFSADRPKRKAAGKKQNPTLAWDRIALIPMCHEALESRKLERRHKTAIR
ncbi:uncharacterized protein UHOD_11566 [Ustilago sp. UG-2017b]|nr:uncharacterized protein UHOD_11566 [Ustilago sp. UG-2017b]